ncbi:DUF7522 family protein [Halopelagius longus]|uniref:Uncharacterized protein n=1 Tax=Halopelagius longus TaxID=1236180 RepID=A0A1H0ZDM0_9EURY|nr:hypothetical protein [Halopelagius longus]RDI70234.1 hypothetical protein DWB78_00010 [Halopelagius longus]SDQ25512.1 hypothetical protein SAMN05216278_1162 [Halopelagius longus]
MTRPKERLVSVFEQFAGDALRDVWAFDERDFDELYVRPDVAERLESDGLDVARFVDNERYGFVTRQTYESLYYADYGYTVRGLSAFEQFRTFLGDEPVGVFASFDPADDCYDYAALHESIQSVAREFDAGAFAPSED